MCVHLRGKMQAPEEDLEMRANVQKSGRKSKNKEREPTSMLGFEVLGFFFLLELRVEPFLGNSRSQHKIVY